MSEHALAKLNENVQRYSKILGVDPLCVGILTFKGRCVRSSVEFYMCRVLF